MSTGTRLRVIVGLLVIAASLGFARAAEPSPGIDYLTSGMYPYEDVTPASELCDEVQPESEGCIFGSTTESKWYHGNSVIAERFDSSQQVASGDLPLDELRSNWGKPWSVSGDIQVADTGTARIDAENSVAWAPTGIKRLDHYWNDSKSVPVDLSATLTPPAAGQGDVRLIFGASGDDSYLYAELRTDDDNGTEKRLVSIGVHDGNGDVTRGSLDLTTGGFDFASPIELRVFGQAELGQVGSNDRLIFSSEPSEPAPRRFKIQVKQGSNEVTWFPTDSAESIDGLDVDVAFNTRTFVGVAGDSGAEVDDFRLADPLMAKAVAPTGVPSGDRAALLFIHGGTFQTETEQTNPNWLNDFASRGYVSVAIDYRRRIGLLAHPEAFAPNSHVIQITQQSGSFDLTVNGDPVTADGPESGDWGHDPSADASRLESAINAVVNPDSDPVGLFVHVWPDLAAASYWLTWTEIGEFPYPAVDAVDDQDVSVTSYVHRTLADQLDDSPLCTDPPDWSGRSQVSGPDCAWLQVQNGYRCAAANGKAFPDLSPTGGCDLGFVAVGQQSIIGPALDDVQMGVRWLKSGWSSWSSGAAAVDSGAIFATGYSGGGLLSLELANRPSDWSRTQEPPSTAPYSSVDSTIAGAAPMVGGWMSNGDGQVHAGAAPVANFQHDVDTAGGDFSYAGALPGISRTLALSAWSVSAQFEQNGFCGNGHMIHNSLAASDEIAEFFASIMRGDSDRGGILPGTDSGTLDASQLGDRQQLHGIPSNQTQHRYMPLAGDFNGDSQTDIYWHADDAYCDSLWLGSSDGGFRTTPLLDLDCPDLDPTRAAAGVKSYLAPPSGGQPMVGDFDGDGRDDLFWFVPDATSHSLWQIIDPLPANGIDAMAEGLDPQQQSSTCPATDNQDSNLFTSTTVTTDRGFRSAFAGNFGIGDVSNAEYTGDDIYFHDTAGNTTTLVSDEFDDTNSTPLDQHTPNVYLPGTSWQQLWPDDIVINENRATSSSSPAIAGINIARSSGFELEVTAQSTDDEYARVWLRRVDSYNTVFLSWRGTDDGSGKLRLYEKHGNAQSSQTTLLARSDDTIGTSTVDLRVEVYGDVVDVYGDIDGAGEELLVSEDLGSSAVHTSTGHVVGIGSNVNNTGTPAVYDRLAVNTSQDQIAYFGGDDTNDPPYATEASYSLIDVANRFDDQSEGALPAVADLNGDGYEDVYWIASGDQSSSAWNDEIWFGQPNSSTMSVEGTFDVPFSAPFDADFSGFAVGDFGGGNSSVLCEGCDDIFLFGTSQTSPVDRLLYGDDDSGGHVAPTSFTVDPGFPKTCAVGAQSPAATVGDFDADGWDDIVLLSNVEGDDEVRYGQQIGGLSSSPAAFDLDGKYESLAGAFNGDAGDDVYLYDLGNVLVSDDFDGQDGTDLTNHQPATDTLSCGWQQISQSGLTIQGNKATVTADPAVAGIDIGRSNGFAVTLTVDSPANEYGRVWLRRVDTNNFILVSWKGTDDAAGKVRVYEKHSDGQGGSQVNLIGTSTDVVGRDEVDLRITVEADVVTVAGLVEGTAQWVQLVGSEAFR